MRKVSSNELIISGSNHTLKDIKKVEESLQEEYDTHIKAVSEKHSLMCTTEKETWTKFDAYFAEYDEDAQIRLIDEVLSKQVSQTDR